MLGVHEGIKICLYFQMYTTYFQFSCAVTITQYSHPKDCIAVYMCTYMQHMSFCKEIVTQMSEASFINSCNTCWEIQHVRGVNRSTVHVMLHSRTRDQSYVRKAKQELSGSLFWGCVPFCSANFCGIDFCCKSERAQRFIWSVQCWCDIDEHQCLSIPTQAWL